MNLNPQILAISEILGVPVYPTWADVPERSTNYIVFVYEDDRPVFYADDEALAEEATAAVHWFFRLGDAQKNKKHLRAALRCQGLMTGSTQELHESDTGLTHIVVSVSSGNIISD